MKTAPDGPVRGRNNHAIPIAAAVSVFKGFANMGKECLFRTALAVKDPRHFVAVKKEYVYRIAAVIRRKHELSVYLS